VNLKGKLAIVTGAASGIGRALSQELARRGAKVVATDINVEGLRETAEGHDAIETARLDVRDPAAFQSLVDSSADAHGSLDYLFNNAGIGVGGEVRFLELAHWERIIDINIRGVVHGVHAAYPRMVEQGAGTIVNTASLAGLGATPLLTPYGMSKHAVVGLSKSLYLEAERHGVHVAALCPGGIDTPIVAGDNPADLKEREGFWKPDVRRYLEAGTGPLYPVEKLASETLDALSRREPLIILPKRSARIALISRLLPSVATSGMRKNIARLWPRG
jgi:NAD(P)-dependent dehydrogenase (short-subunit alcohol dehydrogenase family)